MNLNLISKIDAIPNNYWIEKLSEKSFGFYVKWSGNSFSKDKLCWRIVGRDDSCLLSFDFTGGMVCAIESLINPEPEIINRDYFHDMATHIEGIPILGLNPNSKIDFVLHDNGIIDVRADFFYEKYLNCTRFSWGVGSYFLKINENILFEFSEKYSFVGVSIFK